MAGTDCDQSSSSSSSSSFSVVCKPLACGLIWNTVSQSSSSGGGGRKLQVDAISIKLVLETVN